MTNTSLSNTNFSLKIEPDNQKPSKLESTEQNANTVLGGIGLTALGISLIPQILFNHKHKCNPLLSSTIFALFTAGGCFATNLVISSYVNGEISKEFLPLILGNIGLFATSGILVVQKYIYKNGFEIVNASEQNQKEQEPI